MPFTQVMHKFKKKDLHSGSDKGPLVKDRKQAVAIMMSEKKKADEGDSEYESDGGDSGGIAPSKGMMKSMMSGKKKEEKKSPFKRR